ncbi:MAG: phospholipase D-like domain-containing protein [Methanobrevibacter boviskoreani]|uniref:helicase-related protein n=1 Tax=Methanobrevibacter boviskoreani TaxID=1348249 RepID=UPI0023A8ACC0|nr:helicase-related protein [Methanobrevibacter boviskoreani]MCI6931333.1 phospholipase D-like domain-containing protein [Methanobrevibacter boviskoreani]
MNTENTSFFTNEIGDTLVDRFNKVLKNTEFFDCLVGYFYVSGFYKLRESLKNTKKIRILVGMGIDSQTFNLIEDSTTTTISTKDFKDNFKKGIIKEMNNSKNTSQVEEGARQFVEWLRSGKIEIKAYKERKTHSKLYIMKFPEDYVDKGKVITGSSNFTMPGLEKNLEFNVELSRTEDFIFANGAFEELWSKSEPITEDFINTLTNHTWLTEEITPYELYLKFIYEFLYDKIWNDKKEMDVEYFPPNFKYLDYQRDAVIDAREKIKEYGGVFLSDVVGLGKTYMGALLAQQLKGTTLVIAPPALIDKHSPGSWPRVLREFEVKAIVESKGKLDQIVGKYDNDAYQNVIIDESHIFRNEQTQQYDYLSQICKGKKVILISATPFNNSPMDLLSQIKLFQPAHNSTLPNPKVRDLETYFNRLDKRLKSVDNDKNHELYVEMSKEVAKDIRDNVLQYIMVRRTRRSIDKYYHKDLEKNNMEFPKVKSPTPVYYEFDDYINKVFDKSLELISNNLTYAKYRPLAAEYQVEPDIRFANSQKNMANFIKILLIKRLESGSYAFKKSISNSIRIHEQAIETFEEKGVFYTSRDYNTKIFDLVEDGDIDKIDELVSKGNAKKYLSDEFTPNFLVDLKNDLGILLEIQKMWKSIEDYPKRQRIVDLLESSLLKNKKVIIFTEFIDTADDLTRLISKECTGDVLEFTGKSSNNERDEVLYNFDANIPKENQKNDYRILVTTDTLAHGVNLHRSDTIINFDIPWNPTRIMQRVGRVQRLNTKFKEIYIYNFFPTAPIEKNIGIETLAKNKIGMFIELLGNDSQLLTDEPIKSFDLFNRLNGDLEEEDDFSDDDELKYLTLIRDIRDNNLDLFNKIEEIPKKVRVVRKSDNNSLITLMKTGKFKKVFKTTGDFTEEIDFFDALKELEADETEKGIPIDNNYYDYLNKNLNAFSKLLEDPSNEKKLSRNEKSILKYINGVRKFKKKLTSYDLNYLNKVKELIDDGHITKNQAKKINKQLKSEFEKLQSKENVDEVDMIESTLNILRNNIRDEDLKTDTSKCVQECKQEHKQIILSEYFIN